VEELYIVDITEGFFSHFTVGIGIYVYYTEDICLT